MKKILFVLFLGIIVLLSGCIQADSIDKSVKKDPREVLRAAWEKLQNLKTFSVNFQMTAIRDNQRVDVMVYHSRSGDKEKERFELDNLSTMVKGFPSGRVLLDVYSGPSGPLICFNGNRLVDIMGKMPQYNKPESKNIFDAIVERLGDKDVCGQLSIPGLNYMDLTQISASLSSQPIPSTSNLTYEGLATKVGRKCDLIKAEDKSVSLSLCIDIETGLIIDMDGQSQNPVIIKLKSLTMNVDARSLEPPKDYVSLGGLEIF